MKLNLVIMALVVFFSNLSIHAANDSIQNENNSNLSNSVKSERTPETSKIQSVAAFYEVSNACDGSNLHLMAYGQGTYDWSGPNGFTSNEKYPVIKQINETNSGVYQLTVTDQYGNKIKTSTNVMIDKLPEINTWASALDVCEGDMLHLSSISKVPGIWTGPNKIKSAKTDLLLTNVTTSMSGVYTFTATNSSGCTKSVSYKISVRPQMTKNADISVLVHNNSETLIQLKANGGTSYEWQGPDGFQSTEKNPILDLNPSSGVYKVKITDQFGCYNIETVLVDPKSTPALNSGKKAGNKFRA